MVIGRVVAAAGGLASGASVVGARVGLSLCGDPVVWRRGGVVFLG